MKIIPPGMTFEQALRGGLVGKIVCRPYLDWIKTLPCDTCGAGAPSDPSHFNGFKGMGTKSPDLLVIPQCRYCHEEYERNGDAIWPANGSFMARCALYLLRAYIEGRLVWKP